MVVKQGRFHYLEIILPKNSKLYWRYKPCMVYDILHHSSMMHFVQFNCELIQLYCTWHVDKAFKEQLKTKIKNFAIELEVYKRLRVVLEQTNEKLFGNYSSALCERLHNSVVTNNFADYFDRYWVPYKEKWVIITEWASVLILTCFARLFIAFLNTHT